MAATDHFKSRMLSLDPPCTADEVSVLGAFRRTARAVHAIFAPLAHHSLTLDLREPATPRLDSYPEDALRSLALAVRQAYMPSERTNFEHICRILERTTNAYAKAYIDTARSNWHFALVSPPGLGIEGRSYSGEDVFETWLYARAVHQDLNKQSDAERLDKMGPLPTWVVQCIVRGLAVCILQLDIAVADALGEEPLPDLGSVAGQDRPFRF